MTKLSKGILIVICLVFLTVTFLLTRTFQADGDDKIRRIPTCFSEKKIHQFVIADHVPGIQRLINGKINLNEKDTQQMTPFLYAAFTGNIEVMRLLEHAGANIHIRRYGQNALHLALLNNQHDAVRYLISRGMECRSKDYPDFFYNMGAVKEIKEGEDVEQGYNVFHLLATTGNCEIAMLFNDYKDIIDEKNMSGKTPLTLAAEKGRTAYMSYLLSSGADIDAVDHSGMTPLHCAVAACQKGAVLFLLEKGAKTTTKNESGETLLDTANKTKNQEIAEILGTTGG